LEKRARESWSGRAGFVLATIGSAVGIGSIWKFPYELGANGGSAFLLAYLAGLVLIVIPLMLAEFAIGRRGRGDPVTAFEVVARESGASRRWGLAGLLGVLCGVLILSFYAVIGGWTIAQAVDVLRHGLPGAQPDAARARFAAFLADPVQMLCFHAIFVASCTAIVMRGIGGGIETAVKLLMPVLAVLMVGLVAYSLAYGDVGTTLRFLFAFDVSKLTARTVVEALGLGLFSIGVGMGLMITYAGYARLEVSLLQVALISVAADTAISLLAGFAVFPIVFAHGLDPGSGPALVFETLPLAFSNMPLGAPAAVAFHLLLFIAALASAISSLELAVAWLIRKGFGRRAATVGVALVCFAGGIPTVLSFNLWAQWHPLAAIPVFERATFFDLIDELTSNLMLPIGGLAIAVFAGWAMDPDRLAAELRLSPPGAALLRFTIRFVVPVGIVLAGLAPWMMR
jgi:NSS family neurotransmitter:Na+ symporter